MCGSIGISVLSSTFICSKLLLTCHVYTFIVHFANMLMGCERCIRPLSSSILFKYLSQIQILKSNEMLNSKVDVGWYRTHSVFLPDPSFTSFKLPHPFLRTNIWVSVVPKGPPNRAGTTPDTICHKNAILQFLSNLFVLHLSSRLLPPEKRT